MEIAPKSLPHLVTYKELRAHGVNFSREHIWRLEKAGKFPPRIYLSPQKVAWFEDEILAWLEELANKRASRIYRDHD